MTTSNRISKLRQKLVERELDAMLISQPENRFYLSGFHGSAGMLLITAQDAILATDFRYTEQAAGQAYEYTIFETKGDMVSWLPALMDTVKGISTLGFESDYVTFSIYTRLSDILDEGVDYPLHLIPVTGVVEELRAVKEPEEIDCITDVIALGDTVFNSVEGRIAAGMTEREIAWLIEREIRERGGEGVSFDVIVAAGPNSAMPHAVPTDRPIQKNEPVVIDMGARFRGYCSDLTRTLCLGTHDETFTRVYSTVLTAQTAAIEGITAGMTCREADALAREVIAQAGYGERFGHSLGHGIGLAIHEQPSISPNADGLIKENMIFTVEPGIYLPGWGGVRIEDDVLVENSILKVLSKARKRNQ